MKKDATPLPEDLEAALYDILLAEDEPHASDAAIDALCEQHPEHASALRELAQRVRDGSRATVGVPTTDTPPPAQIGPYRVAAELGRGGFGVVYRAEQEQPLRRSVALKLLAPGCDATAVHARFAAERQILARLAHPNIAQIHDAGTTESGSPWFAMELIDGPSITSWSDQHQPALTELLTLFLEVCDAVQHAHQQGVIHRDLKPGNVLVATVDERAFAKVIDFGIAKAVDEPLPGPDATVAGALIGTPEYMSPEQVLGEPADTRSDVYGLGGLLYRLLTGMAPRNLDPGDSLAELRRDASSSGPARPSRRIADTAPERASALRGDLDWICLTALHREPDQRYASVAELAGDLRRHLEGLPIHARPPSLGYLLATNWRRHKAWLLAIAGAAVLILAASIAMTFLWLDAREQERLASTQATQLDAALADLQRVTDPLRAAEQVRIAEQDLWPALPARIDAFDTWLDATRLLAARLEASSPDAMERAQVTAAVKDVESRRELARTLTARLASEREAWRSAQTAVAADPRFAGFSLPEVASLAPLGPDPDSGLQEFAHLLSGIAPERDASGQLELSTDHGLVLVLVPGGETRIGAQSEDPSAPHYDPDASEDEGPVYTVRLAPFLISKWEVTQGQWLRMSGGNPSRWHDRIRMGGIEHSLMHPVEQVSWRQAGTILARHDLALPTETAWEYAARAGSDQRWLGAADAAGVGAGDNIADSAYGMRSSAGTAFDRDADDGWALHAPIGTFPANAFGLHDVLGNVFEWTASLRFLYTVPAADGRGERVSESNAGSQRDQRVFRGGAYTSTARVGRISRRSVAPDDARSSSIGLRPARWFDHR